MLPDPQQLPCPSPSSAVTLLRSAELEGHHGAKNNITYFFINSLLGNEGHEAFKPPQGMCQEKDS